jgi:hypothetical protein
MVIIIFKNLLVIISVLVLSSCSGVTTNIQSRIEVTHYQTSRLNIQNDSWRLRENITHRIENLGLDVVDLSAAKEPEILINVSYQTYWDVIHQTFTYFNIDFKDFKTGKEIANSRYVGRFGFNDCSAALDLVFEDLSKKLLKH